MDHRLIVFLAALFILEFAERSYGGFLSAVRSTLELIFTIVMIFFSLQYLFSVILKE